MWLINRASHEVSRGTNSDAINRNQRSRKDKHGKIVILRQRYSAYIVIWLDFYFNYKYLLSEKEDVKKELISDIQNRKWKE